MDVEKISQLKHVLRIGNHASSINNWIKFVAILSSLFEAIMLPVFVSLVWVLLYKIKRKINGCDFKLCMEASHGSMVEPILKFVPSYHKLSKGALLFIFLILLAIILGKNIPNIMLSDVIGLYNFTHVVPSDLVLFNKNSDCLYTACTSNSEENFAMVLNSTTIQDKMNTYGQYGVQGIYWNSNDLNNNNTLYAVQAKTNISSCAFTYGDRNNGIPSDNETYQTPPNQLTQIYNSHAPTSRVVYLMNYADISLIEITISDRCDVPLNMFYISPNFSPNVARLAKWLYDSGYRYDTNSSRLCSIYMSCELNISWKQTQIFGNTSNEIKISEGSNFNNSLANLNKLFATNVLDYDWNGRSYGQRFGDSVGDKITAALTVWRNTIKYQGIKSNYNLLDESDNIFSQSLVSSLQSMTNNIIVNIDEKKTIQAPGIWIETAVLAFVILLILVILKFVLTTKNFLSPLSVTDFGIISGVIFSEDNVKASWPFERIDEQHLVTANGYEFTYTP